MCAAAVKPRHVRLECFFPPFVVQANARARKKSERREREEEDIWKTLGLCFIDE